MTVLTKSSFRHSRSGSRQHRLRSRSRDEISCSRTRPSLWRRTRQMSSPAWPCSLPALLAALAPVRATARRRHRARRCRLVRSRLGGMGSRPELVRSSVPPLGRSSSRSSSILALHFSGGVEPAPQRRRLGRLCPRDGGDRRPYACQGAVPRPSLLARLPRQYLSRPRRPAARAGIHGRVAMGIDPDRRRVALRRRAPRASGRRGRSCRRSSRSARPARARPRMPGRFCFTRRRIHAARFSPRSSLRVQPS